MFLVRIDKGGGASMPRSSLEEAIRHLRDDADWRAHQWAGGQLVYCVGPGMSPGVAVADDDSWCLVYGTPSRPNASLLDWDGLAASLLDTVRKGITPRVAELEGFYVLVTYSGPRNELSVYTDRSGMVPAYLSECPDAIWISSSALAIGCMRSVTVCPEAIACLVVTGWCLRNLSLFREVERLGPGLLLRYTDQRLKRDPWWTPPCRGSDADTVQSFAERIVAERAQYLRSRLAVPRRVIASLTAGLDTRCSCALLLNAGVSADYFTGMGGAPWEVPGASYVASHLGLTWSPHEDVLTSEEKRSVTIQTALLSDGENQPFRQTSYWAYAFRAERPVLLWGLTVAWRDYWSQQEKVAPLLKGKDAIERLLNYRVRGSGITENSFAPTLQIGMRQHVAALLRKSYHEVPAQDRRDRLDQLYSVERFRRWASLHIMTSAWWAVPELPLFGQRLLEWTYATPRWVRQSSELLRWVIWLSHPEAARPPYNQGRYTQPRAKARLRDRVRSVVLDAQELGVALKLKSAPRWRRTGQSLGGEKGNVYREMYGDLLDPNSMRSAFLYDEEALRAVVDDHLDRPVGNSDRLNLIIGLEVALKATRCLQC